MEDRKIAEKQFHDSIRNASVDSHVADTRWTPELEDTIKNDPMWVNMKYYAVERKSRKMVLDWFNLHCKGKDVLDYCCGNGEDGLIIAANGANSVTGIDISDVSISNCKESAVKRGVADKTTYLVRDAENTGFADNSFDVITEYGALHHLELGIAMKELARILKPGGKVICNEALGHNPIIHLYRKLTPKLRTAWEAEHIIKKHNIKEFASCFGSVKLHFFHLFTLLAVPFRKMPFFPLLLLFLETIDRIVLRFPFVKWQAWQVVIILEEPLKGSLEKSDVKEFKQ